MDFLYIGLKSSLNDKVNVKIGSDDLVSYSIWYPKLEKSLTHAYLFKNMTGQASSAALLSDGLK